jgi:hypothetical protein
VSPLFEGKCEHGLAVTKKSWTNLEAGLFEKKAGRPSTPIQFPAGSRKAPNLTVNRLCKRGKIGR